MDSRYTVPGALVILVITFILFGAYSLRSQPALNTTQEGDVYTVNHDTELYFGMACVGPMGKVSAGSEVKIDGAGKNWEFRTKDDTCIRVNAWVRVEGRESYEEGWIRLSDLTK